MEKDQEKNNLELMSKFRFQPIIADKELIYKKIQKRIEEDRGFTSKKESNKWKWMTIAASFALLITLSWIIKNHNVSKPIELVEVFSVAGSRVRVILPDSSTVWLNGNTTLQYPQCFSEKNREVKFEGEALFEIAADKERPFIVNVDGFRIKVLGTKFNVFTSLENNTIETTLIEGKVSLFGHENITEIPDALLAPNTQATYYTKNHLIETKEVNAREYISWVTSNYIFDNTTLEEISIRLQHGFQTKIEIKDESLKKIQITARFTNQETLDEILSILQIPARYKYKKEKGVIYIYKN